VRARGFDAPLIYVGGKLLTDRLELEPLSAAHAALMYDGFADRALYVWMHVEPPADAEDLRKRFERIVDPYAPGGEMWLNWAVRRREAGPYLGLIEATVRPDRVALLTFYVFPPAQRQGVGREACTAAIDHLWRAYDAVEVRCEMDYRNVPARCLVERLGFVKRSRNMARRVGHDETRVCRYRLARPQA
jgi:RimJ/RimL family protein N-acetyltransferase